jgi:hypothetical protein
MTLPLSVADSVRVVPDSVIIPAALRATAGKTVWFGAAFNIGLFLYHLMQSGNLG